MAVTATKLRQDIYNILDQVLETGIPVQIERNGSLLMISTVPKAASRLDRVKQMGEECWVGEPNEIFAIANDPTASHEWQAKWKTPDSE